MTVRPAVESDLAAVAEIYAEHVLDGVATFELEPPDIAEWRRRLRTVRSAGLPFLVAAVADEVAGYAYCAPWKPRPAYRQTVEDSVYLAPDAAGRGIGGRVLDHLLADCAAADIRQVIAVIVDADAAASVALHRSRGFVEAGRLTAVGFKHGRWLDTLLLQRDLGG
ncbi:GNAT family N-acetyltransferase [Mycobacterium sp. NPDC050041]|uniref:GNAT family N-acetyltransferase n=1 Tax=Mycobacterium sp. NPDC050041 TaxID=3364293 RepID=UPI003C2AB2DB